MKAYQVKIALVDVQPEVWRRAVIPHGITFSRMAGMFNDIMGWMGSHLYAVITSTGDSVSGMPDGGESEYSQFFSEAENELPGTGGGSRLIDPLFDTGRNFVYVYDLGDDWKHLVRVEECLEIENCTYPQILEGAGACPPEDCGGAAAFMELMNHPRDVDEELRDMYLDSMEPFDKESTNGYLRAVYGGPGERELYEGSADAALFDRYRIDPADLPNLEEALMDYRLEDLKMLCRIWEIKGYSGLRKHQVMEKVIDVLLDPSVMEETFCGMSDEKLEFFSVLCEKPFYAFDLTREARQRADSFVDCGYVFVNCDGLYFVPLEIAELYGQISEKETFRQKRKDTRLILDYCRAAVNLYGIVEVKKLIEIFESQNQKVLGIEDFVPALAWDMGEEDGRIELKSVYFYDREIEEDFFELILEQQKGKPYYIPDREEFLRYADPRYCEKTLAWEGVKLFFIRDVNMEEFDAEFLCHEMQMLVHVGASLEVLMETLDEFDVPEMTESQMFQLTDLLMVAWNCTRMVTNRGFTPNEMKAMTEDGTQEEIPDNVIPFPGKGPH